MHIRKITPSSGALVPWGPGLLCAVALVQLYLALVGTLTPWKGGGFGMFASTDGVSSRHVSVHVFDRSGNAYRVRFSADGTAFPRELRRPSLARLAAMPSQQGKEALGHAMLRVNVVPATPRIVEVSTRLTGSRVYGELLANAVRAAEGLETVIPLDPTLKRDSTIDISKVTVQVFRLRVDHQLVVTLEGIGDPVTLLASRGYTPLQ